MHQVERFLLELGEGFGRVPCKSADEAIAEYAMRDSTAPTQISEYRAQPLPEPYRGA